MLNNTISFQDLIGTVSDSVNKSNEKLLREYPTDEVFGLPPLLIGRVKVNFSGNIQPRKNAADNLAINVTKPDGNFTAELEFFPCGNMQ
jgi:hypothetical protein